MSRAQGSRTVLRRELLTVLRTRAYLALGVGYAAVVVGAAWFSGGAESGYLPTASSLTTPTEILVPVVAFALGYRVVLTDRSTGELDVLRTYGLGRAEYVLSLYAGRLVALSVVLVAPLVVVGGLVWTQSEPTITVIAWHGGVDSPLLLARFGVLTVAFGAAVLSVAVAVSAVSGTVRTALALAVLVWVALALGADLGVIAGVVTESLGDEAVVWLTSLSPNTAFRGLVLETVVGVASGGVRATSVPASVLSLVLWTVAPLVVAVRKVWK
jgi:ABC-2 type transport system permease protein